MKYKDLNDKAKSNAIINYCHIMDLEVNSYYTIKVIAFLLRSEIDTLDETGKFIHFTDNIT